MSHLPLTAQERVRSHSSWYCGDDVEDTYEDFMEQGMSKGLRDEIEQMTRGQAKNPAWKDLRKGLVTASKIKKVVRGMKYPWKNSDNLLDLVMEESEYQSPAMKWGIDHEEEALEDYWEENYSLHTTHKLQRPGLFMSEENPLVGASPDGVVYPKPVANPKPLYIVEVKCPYSTRWQDPEDAALKEACEEGYGGIELKRNHTWYYQVQAQMGVVNVKYADLVVYTTRGICTVRVEFDPEFYKNMMTTVGNFTHGYLYPELYDNC